MKGGIILLGIFFCSFVCALSNTNFVNPVIPNEDNPDPGAVFYNGSYYVVTTIGDLSPSKFKIHKSQDLQNWELAGYVFPPDHLPRWANPVSSFWAPELHIINGQFRVYYTARELITGRLCIGVGAADNILGPYTDKGSPIVKNTTVGSIDASVMSLEDGTYYLLWKEDGESNVPPQPTWIWAQQLSYDGLTAIGNKNALTSNTLAWEGNLIEAPWIIKQGDWYYLFYSGHGYCDGKYSVGVARSKDPIGTYEKKGDPILVSQQPWVGPGHCSVVQNVQDSNKWVMIYHAWRDGQVCGPNSRFLMVDSISWSDDGWPVMGTQGSFKPFERIHRFRV